jgi:hypothetical protein
MDIVLLDPDPNPGMGTRIQDEGNFPKFKNLISSLLNGFCTYVGMFYDILPT